MTLIPQGSGAATLHLKLSVSECERLSYTFHVRGIQHIAGAPSALVGALHTFDVAGDSRHGRV